MLTALNFLILGTLSTVSVHQQPKLTQKYTWFRKSPA